MNEYVKTVVDAHGVSRMVPMNAEETAQRQAEEAAHAARKTTVKYRAEVIEMNADERLRRRLDRDMALLLKPGNPLRAEAEKIEAQVSSLRDKG